MARAIDSVMEIDLSQWNKTPATTKKPSTDFSNVLDGLKKPAASNPVKYDPTAGTYKKVLLAYLNGDETSAKLQMNALSDDEKTSLQTMLGKVMGSIQAEIDGSGTAGSAQTFLNSVLMSAELTTDDADQSAADQAITNLQKLLSDLDDDDTTSISTLLAQLLPMLTALNGSANTVDSGDYPEAVAGVLSVKNGSSTYTMSLENFLGTMQTMARALSGVDDSPIVLPPVVTPPVVTPPTDETPEVPETPETPEIPETPEVPETPETPEIPETPEVPETPETPEIPETPKEPGETQTIENVVSQTANQAVRTYSTLNAQTASASQKLTTEGSAAKALLLAKRVVQKSDELDALNFSLAGTSAPQIGSLDSVSSINQVPLENQISSNLNWTLSTLQNGKSAEMTMTLNPDDLGQITVRMEKTDGKVTVTLMALSEVTQKLLQDKLPSLISNLQNVNSDVKSVQVVEPSAYADFTNMNLNSQSQHSNTRQSSSNASQSGSAQTKETVEEAVPVEFKGGSRLWQTA